MEILTSSSYIKKRLQKTKFANLYRDRISGTYFCGAMVCGQQLKKSLQTKSSEIAKLRLDELLRKTREMRKATSGRPNVDDYAFKQVADAWAKKVKADTNCKRDGVPRKPRAKEYRLDTLRMLRKTWPDLDSMRANNITEADCKEWAVKFWRAGYYPGRFNGCLETLRGILNLAIELGLAATNPALKVKRLALPKKERQMPSEKQLAQLLRHLRRDPTRRRAYWFIRALAYSGKRPHSIRSILPVDVNLERNTIRWRAIKHDKEADELPMAFQMRVVVKELLKSHPGGRSPLVPIKSPRRALAGACEDAKIPTMTPSDFRHLFTTRALAKNIPPAMVALLRGDKDGGKMMLKTYLHGRMEDLNAAVRKL